MLMPFILISYTILGMTIAIKFVVNCSLNYMNFSSSSSETLWLHIPYLMHHLYALASSQIDLATAILLDTGCSQHIFQSRHFFVDASFTPFDPANKSTRITGVGGNILYATGRGDVSISVSVGGKKQRLYLTNVLFCPTLQCNLISGGQLLSSGAHLDFKHHNSTIRKNGTVAAELLQQAGLFIIHTWEDHQTAMKSTTDTDMMWHERLGHMSNENLKKLQKMCTGLDLSSGPLNCSCDVCHRSKLNDCAHRSKLFKDAKPFEIICSDVKGPLPKGYDGSRYWVTFIDAGTRESEVFMMKYKTEVPYYFRQYKAMKERRGYKILRLHSDGGGEYTSNEFVEELKGDGIEHTDSTAFSQQQNGMAERLNRTLYEKAWPMLIDSGLPVSTWPEAVRYANYIRNRSPSSDDDLHTPHERATGNRPDLRSLRKFGCDCWYRPGSQKKYRSFVDEKGQKGHFLGLDSKHVMKIRDSATGRILRASVIKYQETLSTSTERNKKRRLYDDDNSDSDSDAEERPTRLGFYDERDHQLAKEVSRLQRRTRKSARKAPKVTMPERRSIPQVILRSERRDPVQHEGGDIRAQLAIPFLSEMNSRCYTTEALAMLTAKLPDDPYEPTSFASAMKSPECKKWETACEDEMNSIQGNGTWTLVPRPKGRKVLTGKWVFKHKRGLSGSIIRWKSRWVVRGYEQEAGVDYNETFASVVKPMSYKALFAIAAAHDLEIEQMDVKTAFLYGEVEEEIYMEQPIGFSDGTDRVCKLNKALYGLKQSPRVWYKTLADFLQELGFRPLDADGAIFVKEHTAEGGAINSTFVAAYVDDLLIVGRDRTAIDDLKSKLSARFEMTDLGPIAYYLGMTVTRDRQNRRLRLGQQAYLETGIKTAGQWETPSQLTPMGTQRLHAAPEGYVSPPELRASYQSAVGTLMYAMLGTRPDIAYAVSMVSRYASNPTTDHMKTVNRIFSYLKGTIHLQLVYEGELVPLQGWTDSDWAGCEDSRRSTSGFVFNLGSGAVSWSSKRQSTVSLSTCEAEYKGQTIAAKEALWLRQLLRQLIPQDPSHIYATIIYADNQGAIALAKDQRFHARTKHMDIRDHWIREKVTAGDIELQYIHTSKQVADGMTKPLPKDAFYAFRRALGLQ